MVRKQEFGSLGITSKVPGVEVWLSDKRLGKTQSGTEIVVSDLAVGPYTVRAEKEGYKEWKKDVEVRPNEKQELRIDLQSEDYAEMVKVPAGEFWMGCNEDVKSSVTRMSTREGGFIWILFP